MKDSYIGILASLTAHACIAPLLFALTLNHNCNRPKIIPVNFTVSNNGSEMAGSFHDSKGAEQAPGREGKVLKTERQTSGYQQGRLVLKEPHPALPAQDAPLGRIDPQAPGIVADPDDATVVSGIKGAPANVSGSAGTSQSNSGSGPKEGADRPEGLYVGGALQGGKDFNNIRDAIIKNVRYPERARKMGFEGMVLLSFVVLEDGSTARISVVQSSGFRLLDEEAKHVVARTRIVKRAPYRSMVLLPVVYSLNQPTGLQ
jgi:periplasmic protein TonB